MSKKQSVSGSCLCGEIHFQVRLPSLFCAHCHRSICRQNPGAAFVTWFGVPQEAFTLEKGREHLAEYMSSEDAKRFFCRLCGSSLHTQSQKEHADRIDVVLAIVHGPIDREPQLHVFFDEHAKWVQLADELPRLGGPTGFEPIESESSR